MKGYEIALVLLQVLSTAACDPKLNVGTWDCSDDASASEMPPELGPFELPWATGFEDDFCDYSRPTGFCYSDPLALYEIVSSPVHSGRRAAAFRIDTSDPQAQQTRCVRQGVLPNEAYYGAWYFVPERPTNGALWNLLHFQRSDGSAMPGLWDVSLINGTGSTLEAILFEFQGARTHRAAKPLPVPIAQWVHFELYWKRASDGSGSVALIQDGERSIEATGIRTDDLGAVQWYVGNLATSLTPSRSTLYVDDVTIRGPR